MQKNLRLYMSIILGIFLFDTTQAQLLRENFNFTGALTSNGWNQTGNINGNPIQAASSGLTYTGFGGSGVGNAAYLTTTGQDVNKELKTLVNSGSLYAAFLINVSAAQTAGDYFYHFGVTPSNTSSFFGRVFVKNNDANTILVGLSIASTTASYSNVSLAKNQTHLVIVKYTFIAGSNNDRVDLYVNPSDLATEPNTPFLSVTATTSEASTTSGLGTAALRQGASSSAPTLAVDGIRVATTWSNAITPSATVESNPTSVSGLTYTVGNGPSQVSSAVLNGFDLTNETGIITATAPSNFEVSSDNTTFGSTANFNYSAGTFTDNLYVRMVAGLNSGSYNGNISLSGGGVSSTIAVSGYLSLPNSGPCSGSITPITNARSLVDNTIVTSEGRVTASTQFGGRLMFIQDNTGGIALFSNNSPNIGTNFNIGDLVQVRGKMATFQGKREIEITGSDSDNCLTKKDNTNITPVPVAITASSADLAANEGRLVSIAGSTVTSCLDVFYGSTNYTFSQGSNNSELRVDQNTNLSGYQKPSGTFTLTGIIDRFNSLLQILPRSVADVPGAGAPSSSGSFCGLVPYAPSSTSLDVATWNVEWLGHPSNGPSASGTNDATQLANAKTVIGSLNADVIALQEICDLNMFDELVASLGSSYSGECSPAVSGSFVDANPQRVCVIYKNTVISKVRSQVLLNGAVSLPNYPSGNPSQFWASGRKPFLFIGDATLNGVTRRIHFVAVHAKSGSAQDDYARRQYDVQVLYDSLNAQYSDANIVFLGDMNDDMDVSIATPNATSYANFVNDAARYNPITRAALSLGGCTSTASYCDAVDHIILSNEFSPAYIANSAGSIRPSIANYKNTTSDHFPVVARFNIANALNCVYTANASVSDDNICAGKTLSLTVNSLATNASWAGPNAFTSTGKTVTRPNMIAAYAGIYTVTVNTPGCLLSVTATTSVSVKREVNIITPSANCQNATIKLETDYTPLGSHAWKGPNGYSSGLSTPIINNANDSRSGTYSVTVTYNNCVLTASAQILVGPKINIKSNSPVCIGSSIQLSASGGGTYNWRGPNGFVATSSLPFVSNASTLKAGIYSVTVTSTGACVGTATVSVKVRNCTSTRLGAEGETETELVLSPNPTNGKTHINVKLSEPQALEIQLSDMFGRTLENWKITEVKDEHSLEIDLSQRVTGMYLIQAVTNKERVVKKIIKVSQ